MNMNRWMCLAAICLAGSVALAQNEGGSGTLGVTTKIGTLGYGGDLTLGLGPYLNLRGGYFQAQFNRDVDLDEATVNGEFDLQTIPVLLDAHPFGGGFRISGGVVKNGNEVKLSSKTGDILELDGSNYQVERLDGSITFDDYGWYAGIGYGNAVGKDGRWHFACDFGVMYHGEPLVAAEATASNPDVQAALNQALQKEVSDLQEDVKNFKYYPVVMLGVSYAF